MSLSGLSFEIDAPDCDERIEGSVSPEEYVKELSLRKCRAAASLHPDALVIGADTIVCYRDRILGKPADAKEAFRMLTELSGQIHEVFTGVTVTDTAGARTETFCERTEVEFYNLTAEEIREYVNTKEPVDKAGAYGIQGRGALLVRRISGDYCNVVGLPLARLVRILKTF